MILTLGLLTEELGGTIEYSQNQWEMSANTHPLEEKETAGEPQHLKLTQEAHNPTLEISINPTPQPPLPQSPSRFIRETQCFHFK